MSERIAGMPAFVPTVAKPKDASAVVLFRDTAAGREVYWLKRESGLAFAGGFYAFPGGRVDWQDSEIPVDGTAGGDAALKVAAARELFEETGVLVAQGVQKLSAEALKSARQELLQKKVTFKAFLATNELTLSGASFQEAGRWITPPFSPSRFDARFFLVQAPQGSVAENWPGEAVEGGWIRPADALKQWESGQALLHPPNLYALQCLDRMENPADLLNALKAPPHCPNNIPSRIEFQRGIRMFPLETATLPPAAHTNCYVLGAGELLIVDPGSPNVRQYARLLALIAGLQAEGKRPKAIVLTHQHSDHTGGVTAIRDRLRIPVWAHAVTADRVDFAVDRRLEEGETLTLVGTPVMHFKVLHTPGHARGHITLVEEQSRSAIVGDMVSGLSTIVIDPPEGDMTDYVTQLKRLRDLPVRALYPAHGMALPDGVAKLNEYLRHREMREKKIFEVLLPAGSSLAEVVAAAYDDVPVEVHPVAERSAMATLLKLIREGRVVRKDDRYRPVPASSPTR